MDPLHQPGSPLSHWTTDNVGEALPGVATPLGWTIWESASDRMCRDLSYAIGVFDKTEHAGAAPGEDPIVSVFYGRIAMRMEWLGSVGDRMPGTTGPEAIEGMLGRVPGTMTFRPTKRRWPVVAGKLPLAGWRAPREIRALTGPTETYWRTEVARLATADAVAARTVLGEARARYAHAMTAHGIGLLATVGPLIDILAKLVERTGVGDVGRLSGTGGAEMLIVEDLWRASRDQISVDDVAARHGYHGPLEGELSSRVWREDTAPLARMIDAYRRRGDEEDPVRRDERARSELPALQAQIVAELPAAARPAAGALLRHAARTIPLRGVGKASFLQALDVARAAARRLGELSFEDPDDVFYLTLDEVLVGGRVDPGLIAERRAQREAYLRMRLPHSWRGTPEPEVEPPAAADSVTGIGASAGVVEGVARVVRDPSFAEVEDGEILVARTTDPSWASIMFVSAGLVVDIGGNLSHAAVVARELGIPCVVNTRTGTDVLHDGDRVRVDGTTGSVTVLERA